MKFTKKTWKIILPAAVAVCLLVILISIFTSIFTKRKDLNIVLVTIETTRADHLSCYGYSRKTTPHLDALAEEGVRFTNLFVQRSVTLPSLTSIMTSRYPVNHFVRRNGDIIHPSVTQLAQILKKNKYSCGAFLTYTYYADWKGFDRKYAASADDVKITTAALDWIKEPRQNPFFLWIHYWQPHRPYMPPEPYKSLFDPSYQGAYDGSEAPLNEVTLNKIDMDEEDLAHIIALYDGSLRLIDDQLQRIFDALHTSNLENNTLVVITADHGEDLYDHHHYFYHYASVYDSSLHVPLIMRLPGILPAGAEVNEVIESIDIAPTVLDLAGISIPSFFEGKSLNPLIKGKPSKNFSFAISEFTDKILTIRTGAYRYIYNPKNHHPMPFAGSTAETYPISREELYHSLSDPKEQRNIAEREPETAAGLKDIILNWKNYGLWQKGFPRKKYKKHIEEKLKALGYIH